MFTRASIPQLNQILNGMLCLPRILSLLICILILAVVMVCAYLIADRQPVIVISSPWLNMTLVPTETFVGE